MNRGTMAIAVVQHEVVLVQSARMHASREPTVDVFIFRHFGSRTFLADPLRPRVRISAYDLLSIIPSATCPTQCPLTGMLELPKDAYGEYVEKLRRHQKRVAHVWGAAMPFRVTLR